MADDNTPQGDEQDNSPQGGTGGPTPEIDWKAEARKHESRSKEWAAKAKTNEDAARRLAEIEEANKTEAQRAQDRIAELESENSKYKQREQQAAWRAEVAEATGVPAEALRGSTLEEMQEHAETLKPFIATPSEPEPEKDKPVPTVDQTPGTPGNVPLSEQIAAAEKAGNRDLVAALKAIQLGSPS